jgi:iron complex outermembrane recepter protein
MAHRPSPAACAAVSFMTSTPRPAALVFLLLNSLAFAQNVDAPKPSVPPAATAADPNAPVIELSPFEVQADSDIGYQALNTTNGSRLNTRLKDTPAAISPFTPEFLSDIGATSLQDIMAYAANVEMETEDATNGFNNPEGRMAITTDYRFRIRGMSAGASRDFVDSSLPVDFFNVERAEVASGPNSILFGLGNAGGNVALTSKRANASRRRTELSNVIGSWDYERFTLDHNLPLVPGKLGARLVGLYQNAGGWKYWDFNDQKRLAAAVMYRPFKNTTVHLNYEGGRTDGSTQINWNLADQITAWFAAGRPLADGAAIPGTTRYGTNQRYTFVDNDNIIYNLRQELASTRTYNSETLLPPSISPYNFNPGGPASQRHQHFNSESILVQQRAGRVDLELGYFRDRNDSRSNFPDGQPVMFGDPNPNIPPLTLVGTVPNPRARQLYLEQPWSRDSVALQNELYRLTAAWDKDLGKWFGRHRLAGLLEHSNNDRLRYLKNEAFIDQNGSAIVNPANPEGVQNQVWRRHYLTEGDPRTYYIADGSIPISEFSLNGNTYHPQYVSRTKANAHARKKIDSVMLAAQSFWWSDRLVTTAGFRLDRITFLNEREARVSSAADPRVTGGQTALNEWDYNGVYDTTKFQPRTFSAGGVLHATSRLSVFYNASSNRGTPRFDRTVLPDGGVPPPTKGESTDFGLMVDLLGDERYFARVTRFVTKSIGDAPIIPNSVATETSAGLGGDNLRNIYDALLTARVITQAQYDSELVFYSAGMVDVETKGYEVEFVARPAKSLNLRFTYSHSDRNRTHIFDEIFRYYAAKTPAWRQLAANNPALLTTVNSELILIDEKLQDQLDLQSGPLGSRPDKFTVNGRYAFQEGRLRGIGIGGAVRFQAASLMSYNRATGATEKGNETLFGDAFANYRRKAPWGRGTMLFQFNVSNLTNSYLSVIGRRNADGNAIRRVYLNEPRRLRLTTTFEF